MTCTCAGLLCPHCGQALRLELTLTSAASPEPEPTPAATSGAAQTFSVRTPIVNVPVAPASWSLPMAFRDRNPWGYLHGGITDKGQLHPGYDLNNGPTARADLGEPLYAVRPGTVVYAKRTPGWGTLLAVLMDESVDGRRLCYRYGHPDTMAVQWGQHVEAGQLLGTCGDGKNPGRYSPHLHYDLVDIEVLWEQTQGRNLGKPDLVYYGQGMDRALFARLYPDPRRFHPEIDQALSLVGK